jgi:hypothetical protein
VHGARPQARPGSGGATGRSHRLPTHAAEFASALLDLLAGTEAAAAA